MADGIRMANIKGPHKTNRNSRRNTEDGEET